MELEIVDLRGRWPWHGRPYATRPLDGIHQVVVHHTATTGASTRGEALALLDRVQRDHTEARGWPGIAYHYAVGDGGEVYQLHDLERVTFHAGARGNRSGVAVALLGDFTRREPSPAALEAAARLHVAVERAVGRALDLVGHRDLMATACPGKEWSRWRRTLLAAIARERAAGGKATWGEPHLGEGMRSYVAAHRAATGRVLGAERYLTPRLSVAETERGWLVYDAQRNAVGFAPME